MDKKLKNEIIPEQPQQHLNSYGFSELKPRLDT